MLILKEVLDPVQKKNQIQNVKTIKHEKFNIGFNLYPWSYPTI